jgi:hypothetical protein
MELHHTIMLILVLSILFTIYDKKAKEAFTRVNMDDNVLYRG